MRKLRLSDAQMENFERHEASRADMQDAEDTNMQNLQSSTTETIKDGGPTGSKQVTAKEYQEMLNQSLFSTINVDEDYSTATVSDVAKARTYLSFCGLETIVLEHWLDMDGHPVSSKMSKATKQGKGSSRRVNIREPLITSSALRQQNLELPRNNSSLRCGSTQISQFMSGLSELTPTTSNQTGDTAGIQHAAAQGSGQSTLTQTAKVTKMVPNGLLTSGSLTPSLVRVPQAPKGQPAPVRRRLHGVPGDSGTQTSSPYIPYGIDPAIARGHVYNTPIRSIDGLVQPKGRTVSTGLDRSTAPTHPLEASPRRSPGTMTEPLRSDSHTFHSCPTVGHATVRQEAHIAGESGSNTPTVTPQWPNFIPRNRSGMTQPIVRNSGLVKSSFITTGNSNVSSTAQPKAQSITRDGAVPFQVSTQSSRSVASDRARPMPRTIATFRPDDSVSSTDIISVSDTAIALLTQPTTHSATAATHHVPATNATQIDSARQTPSAELHPDIRYMRARDLSRAVMGPAMLTTSPQSDGPSRQSNPSVTTRGEDHYGRTSAPDALSHQHPLHISTQSNRPIVTGQDATYRQPSTLERSNHQHPPHISTNAPHTNWAHRRISDVQSADRTNSYGYPPMPRRQVRRNMSMSRDQEVSDLSTSHQSGGNSMDNTSVSPTRIPAKPTIAKIAATSQTVPQSVSDLSEQRAAPVLASNPMNANLVKHPPPQWSSRAPPSPHSNVDPPSLSIDMLREQNQPLVARPKSYGGAVPTHHPVTSPSMVSSSWPLSPHIGLNISGTPIRSLLDLSQATGFPLRNDSEFSTKQRELPSMTKPGSRMAVDAQGMQQGNPPVSISVQSTTSISRKPSPIDASNQRNEDTAPDMVYSDIASTAQTHLKKRSVPTYTGTARLPPAPVVKSSGAHNVGTKRRNSSETRTTRNLNTFLAETASAVQSVTAQHSRAGQAIVKSAAKKRKTTEQTTPPNVSGTIARAVANGQQALEVMKKNDSTPTPILQQAVPESKQSGYRSRQSSVLDTITVVSTSEGTTDIGAEIDALNPQIPPSTAMGSKEKRLERSNTLAAMDVAPRNAADTEATKRTIPLPLRTAPGQFKTTRKKSDDTRVHPTSNANPQFQAIVDIAPTNRTDWLISKTAVGEPKSAARNRRKSSGPAITAPSGVSHDETSAVTTNSAIEFSDSITTARTKSKSRMATLKPQKPVAPTTATTATAQGNWTTRAQSKENGATRRRRKLRGPSEVSA